MKKYRWNSMFKDAERANGRTSRWLENSRNQVNTNGKTDLASTCKKLSLRHVVYNTEISVRRILVRPNN